MKIPACTTCGSPRVWVDAYAPLNSEEVRTFDYTHCDDCDGECSTALVEVPDDFDMDIGFYK